MYADISGLPAMYLVPACTGCARKIQAMAIAVIHTISTGVPIFPERGEGPDAFPAGVSESGFIVVIDVHTQIIEDNGWKAFYLNILHIDYTYWL
jgi:hypothetical protein